MNHNRSSVVDLLVFLNMLNRDMDIAVLHIVYLHGCLYHFFFIYPSFLTVGISLGYLFHLIGDLFSVQSIPILAPFKPVRPNLPFTYKTGSFTEEILLYIFTFLLLYFVFVFGKLYLYLIQSTVELVSWIIHILLDYLKTISK